MKKHLKYLSYIVRHKYFVFIAGRKLKAPLWRLLIHDWTKFLPCEWIPYVNYFYEKPVELKKEDRMSGCGVCCPEKLTKKYIKRQFDLAWLHHQHNNPHHWQFWILREDSGKVTLLDMPDHFIREMVADWAGAGRAINGEWDLLEWYEKNMHRMNLSPKTRKLVTDLVTYFEI